jgi:hypothetical protein
MTRSQRRKSNRERMREVRRKQGPGFILKGKNRIMGIWVRTDLLERLLHET